ncbi:sulfur oxidation protein of DsrC family protein [Psychromonas sp. CNPT3]|nr:sulfur oxidation protein of DsrC family protein [Psychromonas sp. CNPT3]
MLFNDQHYSTDAQGYLLDISVWNEALATHIANLEGITLTDKHWQVIHLVRDFYSQFNSSPAMRALLKALQKQCNDTTLNSRYLYRLFPDGPAKQATKIAGLPKPARCI